jgi:hypothetical protein
LRRPLPKGFTYTTRRPLYSPKWLKIGWNINGPGSGKLHGIIYEGHVRNHFHDLNSFKINRITIATVEKFITEKQTQGVNIGTLRKTLVSLGQILSYAIRHKYIDFNPLREAERPRRQANGKEEGEKICILTPEQITAFLEKAPDQKYRTLFLMAIMTGARQGELLGNGEILIGKVNRLLFSEPLIRVGSLPPRPKGQGGELTWRRGLFGS